MSDACGGRDQPAMERTLASLAFAGDSIITDTASICQVLTRRVGAGVAPAPVNRLTR